MIGIFGLTFGQPWVLLGLAAPIAILAFVWRRAGGRVALPIDHGLRTTRGWATVLKATLLSAESLPALTLAIAVFLAAGPERLATPRVKRQLTNIQICVDISGSMNASFGSGNRYDAALEAINEFIDFREGDAFGLTFFGNNVLHWVPLTSDSSAIKCSAPFMSPANPYRPPWFGGTSIGKALKACRDVLVAREEGDRMIVLISDGMSSDLGDGMETADMLRKDGIIVYGIHISEGGVPGPIVNVTTTTGGEAFEPGDKKALAAVFEHIDKMQVAKLEKVAAERLDDFELWCQIGLGILAMHLLLQFFLRFTPW